MLEIDGSYGEGGGQILRTAISLAAITKTPVKISNIRSNRPNPGLQASHLEAVNSVAQLCKAKTTARLGDTYVTFEPGKIEGGNFFINIGTAGAISLVIQSLVLPSLHAEKPVLLRLHGGTHVKWSPSMDYMTNVFAYYMEKIGVPMHIAIEDYGFYPSGGGTVDVSIEPSVPKPLVLDKRGEQVKSEIISIASADLKKAEVAERQILGAERFLRFGKKSTSYVHASCPGSAVHAQALFDNCLLGASAIGEKSLAAQNVGAAAGSSLKKQIDSGACLDEFMADQLLPFLALAKGTSAVKVAEITGHVKTNIWVIEQFLPVKFEIDGREGLIQINPKSSS
jgi:RNA 3'-phosphate cyclase